MGEIGFGDEVELVGGTLRHLAGWLDDLVVALGFLGSQLLPTAADSNALGDEQGAP